MGAQATLEKMESQGIVSGMRGAFPPAEALRVVGILTQYGINGIELTMNSEQPIEAMQAIKSEYGDDVCVGMGTVLDVETAKRVLDAGADFVVSPAFQPEVVEVVMSADVLVAPGVITPTEAAVAWSMGVKLLKLFPIGVLGIDYFKTLFAPMNHMKFMCNGGVHPENIYEFIKAGAVMAGMAGWLTGNGKPWADDTLHHRAKLIRHAVDSAKSGQPMSRTI